jgi:cyclomaltodextrinase / maltogenic alpha-amylase / neopullulanase
MNKSAILHIPQSQYAFANSESELTIRLRTAKDDITKCVLFYGDRACNQTPVQFFPLQMELITGDELFDYYEITLDSPYTRVCYYFKLESEKEWTYYYGDQFRKDLPDIILNGVMIEGRSEYYQYPFILRDEILDVPEWFKDAVVYNIFPDSFASGKKKLEKVSDTDIILGNNLTIRSKQGGTLKGITENLDYIKNLGFTCIYLNPIFTAGEYHKYDILDYYHIDPCFGTDEDFKELVEKIHENDMHIVIDGVFNHCSWYFFAFDDVVKNGIESKYKDWFYDLNFPVIRPTSGKDIPNYACFAYERKMPKLNTSNKEVQQYFANVGEYWITEYNIDGWRLDVANEIDRNFWRTFRTTTKGVKKDVVLIGEVWENAETWLRGDAFDSTMNYDFRKHCRDFFGLGKIDAFQFAGNISQMLLRYPTNITMGQLNLLDSHDVPRFLSICDNNLKKWKLAFIFLILCPGVPSLFYGDEKKITGIKEDEYRSPMPWQLEDLEIENFIKEIIFIRRNYINTKSKYQVVKSEKNSRVFSFLREGNKGNIYVCMNASGKSEEIELASTKQTLIEDGIQKQNDNEIIIEPFGFGIYLM